MRAVGQRVRRREEDGSGRVADVRRMRHADRCDRCDLDAVEPYDDLRLIDLSMNREGARLVVVDLDKRARRRIADRGSRRGQLRAKRRRRDVIAEGDVHRLRERSGGEARAQVDQVRRDPLALVAVEEPGQVDLRPFVRRHVNGRSASPNKVAPTEHQGRVVRHHVEVQIVGSHARDVDLDFRHPTEDARLHETRGVRVRRIVLEDGLRWEALDRRTARGRRRHGQVERRRTRGDAPSMDRDEVRVVFWVREDDLFDRSGCGRRAHNRIRMGQHAVPRKLQESE